MTSYKFKFLASQAQNVNRYKNIRIKVANIYFNRQCLVNKVVRTYAQIKIPNTSSASRSMARKMQMTRIKEEMKFLHKKKEQLNRELYECQVQAAHEWGKAWHTIHESIQVSINPEMEKKYKAKDDKINQAHTIPNWQTQHQHEFLPHSNQ